MRILQVGSSAHRLSKNPRPQSRGFFVAAYLFDNQCPAHAAVSRAAEHRAEEGERTGLVRRELDRFGLAWLQLAVDVESRECEPVVYVHALDLQTNQVALLHRNSGRFKYPIACGDSKGFHERRAGRWYRYDGGRCWGSLWCWCRCWCRRGCRCRGGGWCCCWWLNLRGRRRS